MVKNNLKKIIMERGLKENYIATQMGIKPNYFSMIIKGKHVPSVEIALKLKEILNISIEEIFYLAK